MTLFTNHTLAAKPELAIGLAAELAARVASSDPGCRAVILTGSAARSEETVAVWPDRTECLSDLELLGVVPDAANLPAAAVRFDGLAARFAADLSARRIYLQVELTPAPEKYFSTVRPHLFGYELKCCGRQLAGTPDYLKRIPDFTAKEIPCEDAWRLLSNRLVEWLGLTVDGEALALPRQFYVLVKTYLDLATALSLLSGHYGPTYRERVERLDAVVGWALRRGCPIKGDRLRHAVTTSLRFKLDPRGDFEWLWRETSPALPELLHAQGLGYFWDDLPHVLRAVWCWIGKRLSLRNDSDPLVPALYDFRTKIRGWLKLLLCAPRHLRPCVLGRMVRLVRLGSPRSLVYSCAAALSDPATGARPETLAYVARRLPLPCPAEAGWEDLARCCVRIWQQYLRRSHA